VAHAISPVEERRLLGIALVLAGFFCFSVIDTCAKWLSLAGLPTGEVVFVRYAGQFVLVLALFAPSAGAGLVRTRRLGTELVRALCLLASTAANFYAITILPLTVTASISFTMPLIICAISIPLLGEKVGWRRWLAILVGFAGVMIIVRPGSEAFHPVVLISLAGVTAVAVYFLLTRRLAGIDASTTQQFYAAGVSTLAIAPFAINGWVWPADGPTWAAFGMIGVAALVGHQLITVAHRYAPASVLAPFNYALILFLGASSWLIFGEPPDIYVFIGAPIVIGSGLYIWVRERQLAKAVVTEIAPRD
jgi:drug/metabolite transporter (DMT)-like permease